jgi:hypothetical protein
MATSVGRELLAEIERVSALRERYLSLLFTPGVNVLPAVSMMNAAIETAKICIRDEDGAGSIGALKTLQGFTE